MCIRDSTKVTSSLTSAIVGASTKIAVITFYAAFIERDHSVLNWIATLSFFGVLCLYVYDRLFPPKPAADGQAGASGKPSESTPLAPSPSKEVRDESMRGSSADKV